MSNMVSDKIILEKTLEDYWVTKVGNRENIFSLAPNNSTTTMLVLEKKALEDFNRITNGLFPVQLTIILTIYSILLKRYFPDFDGLIYSKKILLNKGEDQLPLLFLTTPKLTEQLREYLNEVKQEVQSVLNRIDYNNINLTQKIGTSNLDDFSFYGICFNENKQIVNKKGFLLKMNTENEFKFQISYSEGFIPDYLAQHFANNFKKILVDFKALLSVNVANIALLNKSEQRFILESFNDTKVNYPKDKTIVDLFEQQVNKTPEALALVFNGKHYSYRELNEQINQLAYYLINNHKVKKNTIVGILLPKSELALISIFAILKTGAAYLPIAPQYPKERINYIVDNSKLGLLILEDHYPIQHTSCASINISEVNWSKQSKENPNIQISETDLAYIIYTSGSTGQPKGVMIEHTSNVNMSLDQINIFDITLKDKIVWFASVAFDASVSEIMMALYSGATLLIPTEEIIKDKKAFVLFLKLTQATVVTFPPSYLDFLNVQDLSNLRCIITAGESAHAPYAIEVVKKGIHYFNAYGPTECAVCVTTYQVKSDNIIDDFIPIGKPIANLSVYILDDYLQCVPVGVEGNIYVSGVGLSRGYLNKKALTQSKFVGNPFVSEALMYHTGDLGKWLPSGDIEFIGRKDEQIKLRGYRIELGEIEQTILQKSSLVKQVAVVLKDINNEKYLVAYIVSNKLDRAALRKALEDALPLYMIPAYFIEIDKLPLTTNGKVDKKALPDVEQQDLSQEKYIAPRNELEQRLVEIWEEVLGHTNIGVKDNFFHLGGHSLLVTQITNRLAKVLKQNISFKDFFEEPTIEGIATKLKNHRYTTIPKAPLTDDYITSPSQERLWILSQTQEGSLAYNMPGVIKILGAVDVDKFQEAFHTLFQKHEILRTYFRVNAKGILRQVIVPHHSISFEIDFQDFTSIKNQEAETEKYLQQKSRINFDLESAPLLRSSLIKTGDTEYIFFLSLHHIIGDGWSIEILTTEVIRHYNLLLQNLTPDSRPLSLQYKDYSTWLDTELHNDAFKKSEKYWLNKFAGELPVLKLPTFKNRPLVQTYQGKQVQHHFSEQFLKDLKMFSKEQDATLFMTLTAGINALFFRYTGQADIILGTPISGREHPDLEEQIGLYLNTLAIRTELTDTTTFLELLKQQKENLLDAYEHQQYPFDELINNLDLKKDTSRSALFDVLVVLQSQNQLNNINNEKLLGLEIEPYPFNRGTAQFDIVITCSESETLDLNIEFNSDIYNGIWIKSMCIHLENLLSQSLQSPSVPFSQHQYITSKEKEQLLIDFNDNTSDYSFETTIIALFETQVASRPNNIALVYNGLEITYQELNQKVNQFANYLRAQYTIQANDLIAINIERSEQLIIAILGVLKSGAAYVPIDFGSPENRVDYILKDSGCKLLINKKTFVSFEPIQDQYAVENIKNINQPEDLIYVIYTSGTTGKPKGVMVEHRNVVNLIQAQTIKFGIDENENILQFSNIAFDASVEQLFLALLNGAKLTLIDKKTILDIEQFSLFLMKQKITHLHSVPAILERLPAIKYPTLKRVISGGDVCLEVLAKKWNQYHRFYNEYGPTETTVTSIEMEYTKTEKFAIGKPISNTQAYILDKNKQVVPIGVEGLLYLSGAGVTRGYLNRTELTNEKFIPNPFEEGSRMYATGDLARYLPDGNIEFIGRADQQVKFRGYRIELGEIEHTILRIAPEVQQVATVVKKIKEDIALVAYIASEKIDKAALRAQLEMELPLYMIPSYFVSLPQLPVNANGKLDRKMLPQAKQEDLILRTYVAPENEDQRKLVRIWEEVLDLKKIGITDNFFELGGDSFKLLKVCALAKKVQIRLEPINIMQNPRIKDLEINIFDESKYAISNPAQQLFKMTPGQRRWWDGYIRDNNGQGHWVNIVRHQKVPETFNLAHFQMALNCFIENHEIFRTVFINKDGIIYQKILNELKIDIEQIKEISIEAAAKVEESRIFDLAKGPILSCTFVSNTAGNFILLNTHHILIDGISLGLINNKIWEYYNLIANGQKAAIKPESLQFKNISEYENKIYAAIKERSEPYWLAQFKNIKNPNFLPKGSKKSNKTQGASYRFLLPSNVHQAITDFSKSNGLSEFITMLSLYFLTMMDLSENEDMVIGTPLSGRDNPDYINMIGFFINLVMLRVKRKPGEKFLDFAMHMKRIYGEAYDHQKYQVNDYAPKLDLPENKHSLPVTTSYISMIEMNASRALERQEYKELDLDLKYEIMLFIESSENQKVLSFMYRAHQFDTVIIEAIYNVFTKHSLKLQQYENFRI